MSDFSAIEIAAIVEVATILNLAKTSASCARSNPEKKEAEMVWMPTEVDPAETLAICMSIKGITTCPAKQSLTGNWKTLLSTHPERSA